MTTTSILFSEALRLPEVVRHMSNLIVSPSYLKEAERCELKGALDQITGGRNIDPLHGKFGDAFGLACAYIAINYSHEEEDVLLGNAFLLAATKFRFLDAIKEKTRRTLIKSILMFHNLWHTKYASEGWIGLESETRIVIDVDGIKVGGAYDLKALHVPSGRVRIFDFKAVESEFMYRWHTNKQILHYTLLDYIHSMEQQNNAPLPDGQGCYFVAVINVDGVALYERQPDLGLYRQLRPYVIDALNKGEALESLDFTVAPGGWACNGRQPCKYNKVCYKDGKLEVKLHKDTRVFDDPIEHSMSRSMLLKYVDALVKLLDLERPAWEAKAELQAVAQASLYDVDDADDSDLQALISETLDSAADIAALLD